MRREIVWEWTDRPGLEHLSLEIGENAIRADGLVLVALDESLVRLRYAVECDGSWNFRRAELAMDRAGEQRSLTVARDEPGDWVVDGAPRRELAGCTEIDIMATPFTNTLPVRRLRFAVGEPVAVRMVYIALPDLAVRPMDQEYTRLDDATPPRRFRYRNLAGGFTADLALDADGIVLDYPPVWSRR